ncbi:hypothetical protein PVAP13_7KG334700 [Panicum virgatum]|uniref:Uncharacterized protein n=1 Tax=Panicum virgatum TaxID=38727 RepID=A0A8T0QJV8_PANVG|nr:hypothetical protein PVAP13_7KG334700 [Panicum virgatum]
MAVAHSPRGVAVGELSAGGGGGVLHGDPRSSSMQGRLTRRRTAGNSRELPQQARTERRTG